MTVGRTKQRLFRLVAAVLAAALPSAAVVAQDKGSPPGAGPPVWPSHAAGDDDVAARGRQLLPFTPDQIRLLSRLLEQTQAATARGAGSDPKGRVRRVRVDPESGRIPEIHVRRGYVTAVSISDLTGAPWPIEEVLVDRRFLPEDDEAAPGGHLVYLAPQHPFLRGNLVIKLRDLAEPVVATLSSGGAAADFRVDLRLGVAGPNVDAAALVQPESFRAGDAALLGILTGTPPKGARRLVVDGGSLADRAWRDDTGVLLLTRAHVLSPGPFAAERGSAGRWAYRLPDTPHALVSADGREARLTFRNDGEAHDGPN